MSTAPRFSVPDPNPHRLQLTPADPLGHTDPNAYPVGMPPKSTSGRRPLPPTRESITHKFQIMGQEGYLTIGLFEDGQPGEVFIKMSKEGSTLSGLIQGYCRAFSLALQYGLPVEEAVRRFKGMRFEPMGPTANPDIPEAQSILDYLARYLELHFVQGPVNQPASLENSDVWNTPQ